MILTSIGTHRYRLTAVDRDNEWKGEVREMWTVDQTKFHKGTAFFAFTKIGAYGILLGVCGCLWLSFVLSERVI